jgi:hypothetical protein
MSVYLFTVDFPEYAERMEVIGLVMRMNMLWDSCTPFELVPMVPTV